MVLNEIIEQAGRQSRASEQNGTIKYIYKKYRCCFCDNTIFVRILFSVQRD